MRIGETNPKIRQKPQKGWSYFLYAYYHNIIPTSHFNVLYHSRPVQFRMYTHITLSYFIFVSQRSLHERGHSVSHWSTSWKPWYLQYRKEGTDLLKTVNSLARERVVYLSSVINDSQNMFKLDVRAPMPDYFTSWLNLISYLKHMEPRLKMSSAQTRHACRTPAINKCYVNGCRSVPTVSVILLQIWVAGSLCCDIIFRSNYSLKGLLEPNIRNW
jgi:hypothetical protein